MTRCAIWATVSTNEQENQCLVLREWARRHGLEVVREFAAEDAASTQDGDGTNGTEFDAARAELLKGARLGNYHVILIWALDRLSRSGAEDTLTVLRQLAEYGIDVRSHQEPWLRTRTPETRELLVGIVDWRAEQESSRRSEQIKAGLARRRAQGKPVGGRKPGARDRQQRGSEGYAAAWSAGGKRREATERDRASEAEEQGK